MDLPTYTNIWRIEKRLYKLYDLRLPMPMPLVQIGVFVGVFLPWIILLQLVRVPFHAPWHVVYIVPPGVLTWLATRPVIEGKRLTELLISQVRYLTEARTWARLTPIREPGDVAVVGRVWRRRPNPARGRTRAGRHARPVHGAPATAPTTAPTAAPAIAPALTTGSAPPPGQRPPRRREHVAAAGPPETDQASRLTPRDGTATVPPVGGPPHRHRERAPASPPPRHDSGRPAPPDRRRGRASAPPSSGARPAGLDRPPGTPPAGDARRLPSAAEDTASALPSDQTVTDPRPDQTIGDARADQPIDDPRPEQTVEEPRPDRTAGDRGADREGDDPRTAPTVEQPGTDAPPDRDDPPSGRTVQEPRPDAVEDGSADLAVDDSRSGRTVEEPRPDAVGDGSADLAVEEPRSDAAVGDGRVGNGAEDPAHGQGVADPLPERTGTDHRPDRTLEDPRPDQTIEDPRPDETVEDPRPGQTVEDLRRNQTVEDARRGQTVEDPRPGQAVEDARPGQTVEDPRPGQIVWPPPPGRAARETGSPVRPERREDAPPVPQGPPAPEPWRGDAPAGPAQAGRPGERPGHRRPARRGGERSRWPGRRDDGGAPADSPARSVRSGPAAPVRPGPAAPPPGEGERDGDGRGARRVFGGGARWRVPSAKHREGDYEERVRTAFTGARRVIVLGCTGGAGQTVTGLMLGHTFAQHRGDRIAAIDVNPGPGALARRTRTETRETLTSLIAHAEQVTGYQMMRRYVSVSKSGLEVVAAGKNPVQALDDRDYALATRTLDRFYAITVLDAAAAVVARVLPYADQIVLVAPASADASRAVAMTFEWLDGHGYEDLRSRAVTVINGVSRRSMDDVEQAESVARGRCRALVRIPWDDHLSLDRAPRNELRALRGNTRSAYVALGGVVAGGFVQLPDRYPQREVSR